MSLSICFKEEIMTVVGSSFLDGQKSNGLWKTDTYLAKSKGGTYHLLGESRKGPFSFSSTGK